jgi:hypothetical protein
MYLYSIKSIYKIIFSLLFLFISNSSIFAQKDSKLVLVEGKKMSYKTFNLEKRKDGEPILVLRKV